MSLQRTQHGRKSLCIFRFTKGWWFAESISWLLGLQLLSSVLRSIKFTREISLLLRETVDGRICLYQERSYLNKRSCEQREMWRRWNVGEIFFVGNKIKYQWLIFPFSKLNGLQSRCNYAAVHCGQWCWHKGNSRGQTSDGTIPDPNNTPHGGLLERIQFSPLSSQHLVKVNKLSLIFPSLPHPPLSTCLTVFLSVFSLPSYKRPRPSRHRPSSKNSSGLIGGMSVDGSEQEMDDADEDRENLEKSIHFNIYGPLIISVKLYKNNYLNYSIFYVNRYDLKEIHESLRLLNSKFYFLAGL